VPAGDDLTSDVEGILEGGKTVGKLLSDGIACRAGDRAIGRDTTRPLAESLNEKLRELAVDTGLSLIVTATDA
jgi:cobalamin biosynthesis protein CbiD